jgi:hypothetical protein
MNADSVCLQLQSLMQEVDNLTKEWEQEGEELTATTSQQSVTNSNGTKRDMKDRKHVFRLRASRTMSPKNN